LKKILVGRLAETEIIWFAANPMLQKLGSNGFRRGCCETFKYTLAIAADREYGACEEVKRKEDKIRERQVSLTGK